MEKEKEFSKSAKLIIAILLVVVITVSGLFVNSLRNNAHKTEEQISQKAQNTLAVYMSEKKIEFPHDNDAFYFLEFEKTYCTISKTKNGYSVALCGNASYIDDNSYEYLAKSKLLSFTSKITVSKKGTHKVTYLKVHGKTIIK